VQFGDGTQPVVFPVRSDGFMPVLYAQTAAHQFSGQRGSPSFMTMPADRVWFHFACRICSDAAMFVA
jgi:hypothetical protein